MAEHLAQALGRPETIDWSRFPGRGVILYSPATGFPVPQVVHFPDLVCLDQVWAVLPLADLETLAQNAPAPLREEPAPNSGKVRFTNGSRIKTGGLGKGILKGGGRFGAGGFKKRGF